MTPRWRASSSTFGTRCELGGEELDRGADLDVEILHPARDPHGPRGVAEVAPQLPHHRGDGERGERHADIGVEPLGRLEDAEHADLDEIVERLSPVVEPAGTVDRNPAVLLDQVVPQLTIAGRPVADEPLDDLLLVSRHCVPSWRGSAW